jgi:CRISPR-associated protein (TIGR03984 family)
MTKRTINDGGVRLEPCNIDHVTEAWLLDLARTHNWSYALAHADDGVIWGELRNGGWVWSPSAFPGRSPLTFRAQTLRELRCFGERSELFVWRTGTGFAGRIAEDGDGGSHFDEAVLLWGTEPETRAERDGFLLMVHGQQGIRHMPPTSIADSGRLTFRHYLAEDANGCLQTVASRLTTTD